MIIYKILIFISFINLWGCDFAGKPKILKKIQDPTDHKINSDQLNFEAPHPHKIRWTFINKFYLPQIKSLINSSQELRKTLLSLSSTDYDELKVKNEFKLFVKNYFTLIGLKIGPIAENQDQFITETWSYPYLNTCGIDHIVAEFHFQGTISKSPPFNQKGIGALDYLIFETSLNTSCSRKISHFLEKWLALPNKAKKHSRISWAIHVLDNLINQIQWLEIQWNSNDKIYWWITNPSNEKKNLEELAHLLLNAETIKEFYLEMPFEKSPKCKENPLFCKELNLLKYSELWYEAFFASFEPILWLISSSQIAPPPHYDLIQYLNDKNFKTFTHKLSQLIKDFNLSKEFINKYRMLSFENFNAQQSKNIFSDSINYSELYLTSTYEKIENPLALEFIRQQLAQINCETTPTFWPCHLLKTTQNLVKYLKIDLFITLSLVHPPHYQGDND